MKNEEQFRQILKDLLYDEWRWPRVRPRPNFSDWMKIRNDELGVRRGKIQALVAVLEDAPHEMFGPLIGYHKITNDLLDEARAEHGWCNPEDNTFVRPPWMQEEAEWNEKCDRGTSVEGPFYGEEFQ